MFGDDATFGSSKIALDHESTDSDEICTPKRKASPVRLAELVHHLGDVPVNEARRAIRRTGQNCDHEDPLSVVAAALIQLRRDSRRCVGV